MVNNNAQLYTIEGIAAAVLMVLTAYLVLNSTILLTPADTHITDMQLEQLGNDVLRMMDTATFFDSTGMNIYEKKKSFLEEQLSRNIRDQNVISDFTSKFIEKFRDFSSENHLKVYPTLYYWDSIQNRMESIDIWDDNNPKTNPLTSRDHYVTVTRWIYLNNPAWDDGIPKTVLLEVHIWKN